MQALHSAAHAIAKSTVLVRLVEDPTNATLAAEGILCEVKVHGRHALVVGPCRGCLEAPANSSGERIPAEFEGHDQRWYVCAKEVNEPAVPTMR